MHPEILTDEQARLLPFVRLFRRSYYLVGGTAIALQIGHRRSLDFDLFRNGNVDSKKVSDLLRKKRMKYEFIFKNYDGYHFKIGTVKFTFFRFPYNVEHKKIFDNCISMPLLLDLAAMKAFAFSGRGKWKDYVDMYFLLRDHFSFDQIASRAEKLFEEPFSRKLFRTQLSFFGDINYDEEVEYLVQTPSDEEIKSFLTEVATRPF
jgi:hypothetical protein